MATVYINGYIQWQGFVVALYEIWHYFLDPVKVDVRNTLLNALMSAGVHSSDFHPAASMKAGIVLFDQIKDSVFEFLRDVSRHRLNRIIAVSLSDVLSDDIVWRLLRFGASDVFCWSAPNPVPQQIAARFERWQGVEEVLSSPLVKDNLVGQSAAWVATLRETIEVAQYTDSSVLITGESGTGKEMIARLIHSLDSRRRKRNLVVLDCTTIVPELSGSEFFGHERGAFTGAIAQREGAFALADGGTLFLDEVGEMPLPLQAELLRVVQEHTYKRVGSNNWQRTDFRLICATNRDLIEQEQRLEFRKDFYHRIAAWTCHLPTLRDRPEDIVPLALHFLHKHWQWQQNQIPEISEPVRRYLTQRSYPGNIRQLSQLVSQIACRHVGTGPISVGDIPESEWPENRGSKDWRDAQFERGIRRALLQDVSLKSMTNAVIEIAEILAMEDTEQSTARAAEKLGINERTLQMHRAARRQG